MVLQEKIKAILANNFHPSELEVVNKSHLHAGHQGDDGSGQSHFDIIICSDVFADMKAIDAHRLIYKALEEELEVLPHALSIKASAIG